LYNTSEAQKLLDLSKDFLLPKEEVSKAMFAVLTDKKYKSGTILEVCDVGKWREVELLNDPGPVGPASQTSKKAEAIRDIMQYLSLDSNGSAHDIVNTD
jgi:3-hydroxybutyrate dehydrogenase